MLQQPGSNNLAPPLQQRPSLAGTAYSSSSRGPLSSEEMQTSQMSPSYGNYPSSSQNFNAHNQPDASSALPPFSSIQTMGPPAPQQSNVSLVRYQASEAGHSRSNKQASGSKRQAPTSSTVTSADSSDFDDDDGGDLPVSGLVAPWEVLRGLADVAIERAAKVYRPIDT
jgi:hypothetical protein